MGHQRNANCRDRLLAAADRIVRGLPDLAASAAAAKALPSSVVLSVEAHFSFLYFRSSKVNDAHIREKGQKPTALYTVPQGPPSSELVKPLNARPSFLPP